jgi:hypothetical protein
VQPADGIGPEVGGGREYSDQLIGRHETYFTQMVAQNECLLVNRAAEHVDVGRSYEGVDAMPRNEFVNNPLYPPNSSTDVNVVGSLSISC